MFAKFKIIGFVLLLSFTNGLEAKQKYTLIENLKGYWKFSLGDDIDRANPNYDDSDWDRIRVPSAYENEGYNGYDGYSWYRKDFEIDGKYIHENLYLSLGLIDDVADIYINGELIGNSGSFPPNYKSAYNSKIWLPLPKNLFNGKSVNSISVRVYDEWGPGGIVKGDVGIYMS